MVGLGYIAQVAVLPAFKNAASNSILSALVSGDKEKLEKLGKQYGVENLYDYSQFETLLRSGEIDAVYIATPNDYHRNIMELSTQYGVHVLCEKPMAVTAEDCESMLQAARQNHIKFMIAYRLHFEAANLEVIRMAKHGDIGKLKIFNSVFTMQVKDKENIRLEGISKGGGPLYDIGIYCLNASRYLFGAEPEEVFAIRANGGEARFSRVDEMMSVVLKFPDERLATFSISFGAYASADYDLIGTKGRLRLENGYEYADSMQLRIYKDDKIETKKFSKRDQFGPELEYFSDCILNNKKPEPSGEEGLADIRIIEAILVSSELGLPVKLDKNQKHKRPDPDQRLTKPAIHKPPLFHVTEPGGEKH